MRQRKRNRLGFTLVELLVVISIIGMLMALLLPAVQNARESGRQTTCRSNQKQIFLGIQKVEDSRKRYPGYVDVAGEDPMTGLPTRKSWGFLILPTLERNDIYDVYVNDPSSTITQTVTVFTCPSDPAESATILPPSSFVLNTGRQDHSPTTADDLPRDWKENGVFHNAWATTWNQVSGMGIVSRPLVAMNSSYITARDGLGTTLMILENADVNSWTFEFPGTLNATSENLLERDFGCNWKGLLNTMTNQLDPDPSTMRPNSGVGSDVGNASFDYCRPGAIHPTGLNVAFCDGHQQFLSQDIKYEVFIMLMTPSNRGVWEPGVDRSGTASNEVTAIRARVLDEKDF